MAFALQSRQLVGEEGRRHKQPGRMLLDSNPRRAENSAEGSARTHVFAIQPGACIQGREQTQSWTWLLTKNHIL